ncbi:MAG: DUF192 domain-containing protein [Patescibacteria group bacterium]|nr:DUF192 domain-containing protein [Patescibacteria group bacterium]
MATNTPNPGLTTAAVTLGTTSLVVEVADTDAEREQGLSDRTSLLPGHGMLFIFDQAGMPGFWMKDMQFSLDMIWADQSGTVVSITQDATPGSYNASNPQASQVFYPSKPAKYVLEVPAGFAAENGIVAGSIMHIGQ